MTEWHPLRSSKKEGTDTWQSLNEAAEKRARNSSTALVPNLDHLNMDDYAKLYEPADDTFLLIDGILYDNSHGDELQSTTTKQVLEIGCGSGVPIVFLGKLLQEEQNAIPYCIATDINSDALHAAQKTAKENGLVLFEAVQCDLASSFLTRCERAIDVIIFNPPYVPTPDEEVSGNGIEASWAGGLNGRRVIDRAIPQIAKLLSRPRGICYLITVDDNKPEEMAILFQSFGLEMKPILRRRAFNEYLTVQKLTWISTTNAT